jgi:hypothetical protein
MNKEQYKKLNDYLNDVFIYLEKRDFLLIRNIKSIAMLNDTFYSFIKNYDLSYKPKENKLTFNDVFILAREIIETINKDYLQDFDKMIDSGQLDFSYNREYSDSEFIHLEDYQVHNLININREFNYSDVDILIHEFIHYTNGNKKQSINRYLLTEFLSIYFENYAIDYLIAKGIDKEEINYNDRLLFTKRDSNELIWYEIVLLAYEKFGEIDENTINYLNEFYVNISKESFDKECLDTLKHFEKIEKNYMEDNRKEFNHEELTSKLCSYITKDYRYILGTLLAYYARKYCDMKDIVYLNDHINDEEYKSKNMYEILLTIGIDLDDENFKDKVLISIEEYINKYNNDLKR